MFLRILLGTLLSALFNCAFAGPTDSRLTPVDADRLSNLLAAVAESINERKELRDFINSYADIAIRSNFEQVSGVTEYERFLFYDTHLTNSEYMVVSSMPDVQGKQRFQLRITSPYSLLTGGFDVNRTIFGHHITGEGIFAVKATNLTMSFLDVQMSEDDKKELHLDNLGFAIEVDHISFKSYGLEVDDMSPMQFDELVAEKMFDAINALSPKHYMYPELETEPRRYGFMEKLISYQIRGYTMDFATCWLKEN